jgi:hypothetical protein
MPGRDQVRRMNRPEAAVGGVHVLAMMGVGLAVPSVPQCRG